MIPYRKFSDAFKDRSWGRTPANAAKAAKVAAANPTNVETLDALATLGGHQPDFRDGFIAETAATDLLGPLFKASPPAVGEPNFEAPRAARRGRVEWRPGQAFVHFCPECGRWGSFGYDVNWRIEQKWP